jgi:hypothetical protein
VVVVGGQVRECDEVRGRYRIRGVPQLHADIAAFARWRNPMSHMTVAFRTDLIRSVGGYPNVYLKEDYALWGLLLHKGHTFGNLADVLVDATAGDEMLKRRGGLRYFLSEVALQRFFVAIGYRSVLHALVAGLLRSLVVLSPVNSRRLIYSALRHHSH